MVQQLTEIHAPDGNANGYPAPAPSGPRPLWPQGILGADSLQWHHHSTIGYETFLYMRLPTVGSVGRHWRPSEDVFTRISANHQQAGKCYSFFSVRLEVQENG